MDVFVGNVIVYWCLWYGEKSILLPNRQECASWLCSGSIIGVVSYLVPLDRRLLLKLVVSKICVSREEDIFPGYKYLVEMEVLIQITLAHLV